MKKILIIGDFPAPYRVEVFRELAKRWDATVYFEIPQDGNRDKTWLKNESITCNIIDSRQGKAAYWNNLRKIRSYDLVLLYNNALKYSVILEIICKIKRIPFFINCDGCNHIEENNLLKLLAKKYLMRGAAGYFAGGNIAKNYFIYYGADPEKIHIHNFTALCENDIEKTVPAAATKESLRRELCIQEKSVIITVGRHIECKGFDVVLKAAEKIGKKVGVYIIGGEPAAANRKYKELHQLDNVHFIGFKSRQELKKYYMASDLFVLMTRGDTWGLVINEAMANGLPVITTDQCVAGKELICNGENGYVIAVDDVDTLIEKSNRILEDSGLAAYMAENNISKIQKYSLENMVEIQAAAINNFLN